MLTERIYLVYRGELRGQTKQKLIMRPIWNLKFININVMFLLNNFFCPVSIIQLVGQCIIICRGRSSNPGHPIIHLIRWILATRPPDKKKIIFFYMKNPLNICTAYVADFIYLYLWKQVFIHWYEKVDMIKFWKLMTIFKISTII